MLVNASYTVNADHDFVSTPAANEITAVGYARQTLAGRSVVESDADDKAYFRAGNVTFPPMATGQTIQAAILFYDTGSDATAVLIQYVDLGGVATDGNAFRVTWNASGVFSY